MKVRVWVSMNLVGCVRCDEIEVDDNATEEEVEESVRDWMFEHIEWGYDRD